jgi:prepilin-type N-terminal cleavage/methylation domain-containing protein
LQAIFTEEKYSPRAREGCRQEVRTVTKQGQSTQGGFTLVELAVALSVLGVLAMVSVPAITRYIQDYRLDGASSNLIGELRLCRHRAVAEGNNYVMILNPATETYTILDDDNNNGDADHGEQVVGPVDMPGGLDLRNGPWIPFPDDKITLRPNGTADATGILTVRNNRGRERLLYMIASTGFAKKLWEYEAWYEDES